MSILSWLRGGPKRFVSPDAFVRNRDRQLAMTPMTLEALRDAGAVEGRLLKVEFFFYTDAVEKADALANELCALGYEAKSEVAAGDSRLKLVTGWTTPLAMSDAVVTEWTRRMCELGMEHDCEFDGWGTTPAQ